MRKLLTFVLISCILIVVGCIKNVVKEPNIIEPAVIKTDEFSIIKTTAPIVELSDFAVLKATSIVVSPNTSIVVKIDKPIINLSDIISNIKEETIYEVEKGSITVKKTIKTKTPNLIAILTIFICITIVTVVTKLIRRK